jgi:RNA polymerase sigma-70 factor (ECF subfamily)
MATPILWFADALVTDPKVLAAGLRRRDPELLDQLIVQYQYRLFRYLLCLTASRETAEDLFQETWFRVLDRGDQFTGKTSFEGWLFTIARNLVIDLHRRRKPDSLDALEGPDPVTLEPSPLDRAASCEREQQMQASLDRLPALYREVLLLRFQEDLSLLEIAEVVNAPLPTIKSRLYRGLELLRGDLGESHAG